MYFIYSDKYVILQRCLQISQYILQTLEQRFNMLLSASEHVAWCLETDCKVQLSTGLRGSEEII